MEYLVGPNQDVGGEATGRFASGASTPNLGSVNFILLCKIRAYSDIF